MKGVERIAACVVLSTTRADINSVVKRLLDVRKCSFLPMDRAVELTGMEYGGITPIGLPVAWPVYVDSRVTATDVVIIGSGVRRSKLLLPGRAPRNASGGAGRRRPCTGRADRMTRLTDPIRVRLLETLAGQRSGVPAWVQEFENGDDEGFFGPDSAAWAIHGAMPTLVAGIRALLMQALHPGALAGVRDWSRYREDPLGRLAGTIRWIHTVTYGDTAQAEHGSAWVLRLHERVVGTYVDAHGEIRRYAANDPNLLSWVHLAFTDSFLTAHEIWGAPIPGGSDGYVREWARAGELMNVPNPPRSRAELKAQLAAFLPELRRRCGCRRDRSLRASRAVEANAPAFIRRALRGRSPIPRAAVSRPARLARSAPGAGAVSCRGCDVSRAPRSGQNARPAERRREGRAKAPRAAGLYRFLMSDTASIWAFASDFACFSSRFSFRDLVAAVLELFFFGDLSDMVTPLIESRTTP